MNDPIRYGSVCSGIEAATVAWEPLGWKAQWFCEREAFPCKVLSHHYPDVPNVGDMLKIDTNETYQQSIIDLLVGGTPCQSFSIAGLRGGLADQRGSLALKFCRILLAKQPGWFVWENVPGVFSSFSDDKESSVPYPPFGHCITQTADFATLLSAFSECGYSCAWRVLDAQYFGVPQRRRRVFVVGYLGNDWRPPFAVLFERESLLRDITPSREKRQIVAGTLESRTTGGGFPGTDGAIGNHIIPVAIRTAQTSSNGKGISDVAYTLDRVGKDGQAVAYSIGAQGFHFQASQTQSMPVSEVCPPLDTSKEAAVVFENIVRRLTPLECERLQGFPDHYTNIPGASDTARYKAIGNSMAVPVMRWIGERIDLFNKHLKNLK